MKKISTVVCSFLLLSGCAERGDQPLAQATGVTPTQGRPAPGFLYTLEDVQEMGRLAAIDREKAAQELAAAKVEHQAIAKESPPQALVAPIDGATPAKTATAPVLVPLLPMPPAFEHAELEVAPAPAAIAPPATQIAPALPTAPAPATEADAPAPVSTPASTPASH